MPAPAVAVGPSPHPWAVDAVTSGGGRPVDLGDPAATALVWLDSRDVAGLASALLAMPDVAWVQLPSAGIEAVAGSGLIDQERTWTCAKGSYAEPVAEHALGLALAGLRHLPERVAARTWGAQAGTSLYDDRVTILGGGGIATALLALLAPMRVHSTVVRRSPLPLPGASRTLPPEALHEALSGALVVFVALALTPETTRIVGPAELAVMDDRAWLVNVARGPHLDTAALVDALVSGSIAGAALDVTDPEPLPDGHPLWALPNAILSPHSANTFEMTVPLLAARITENTARFGSRRPLVGIVDPLAGY